MRHGIRQKQALSCIGFSANRVSQPVSPIGSRCDPLNLAVTLKRIARRSFSFWSGGDSQREDIPTFEDNYDPSRLGCQIDIPSNEQRT